MGAISDTLLGKKISLSEIEQILKILISQEKYKSQNNKVLQEIGLLKEFSYIKSNKSSNELIYYSKNNKTIKNYIKPSKINSNFIKWTKILFDINDLDLDSDHIFNQKIENLKKYPLTNTFFQNNLKKYLFKDNSLNKLLNYGIPNNLRDIVWDTVISEKYANHKFFNQEQEKKEYNSILKRVKINAQIEKDLKRTFIQKSEQTEENIQILRNLLNCISEYNNYGYCQGMNFIAGFLLKITNFNEIKTFYIFKNILSDIKGYFEEEFPLLKENMNLFDIYFHELNPKLYKHFKNNELYNELWVGKWFQALFTISLPYEELCHIWDILLIKGFNYIIFISLAMVEALEEHLLELNDSSDIYAYLENALNPNETLSTKKEEFGNMNENIIPLNEILSNASKIERKIKENYSNICSKRRNCDNIIFTYNSNINNLKKEHKNNYNDNASEDTKDSDNSLNKVNSVVSKTSNISYNITSPNNLNSSNLTNAQFNINNFNNNLCNVGFGLNYNINNNIIYKNSTFYLTEKSGTYNNNYKEFNKRRSGNLNGNNFNFDKIRNSYITNNNNILSHQGQLIYFSNNYNLVSNNMAQYTNFFYSNLK